MKKPKNHKQYMKSFAQFMRPMADQNQYFKNFKLSQRNVNVKGGAK